MSKAPRYLVAGPAWVGDMVMAQSLFITLKQQHPDAVIDVLAPSWSVPLLARMPEVNEAITVPVGHGEVGFGKRRRLGRSLRARRYDRAIIIPRSMKAALIPFFAGAKLRTGYRGEMRFGLLNDIRPLDKSVLTRTVQRYVSLGLPDSTPLPPPTPAPTLRVDKSRQQQLFETFGLSSEIPAIGFMTGAEYGPAKQWPIDAYAELAERLVAAGYQVWLFGSRKDSEAAERIAQRGGGAVHNLCGRTELVDAVDLIAACRAAVSNDSGLMHVAAAVGTPLVVIYGSSTPDYTPPLTGRAEVLYLGLDCSPCFKRVCPLGHTHCLTQIGAGQVMAALERLLSNSSVKEEKKRND